MMLSDMMGHSFDDCCRLIAVGRMTAIFKFKHFNARDHARDALDLLHGSVLVLFALDSENLARDSWQVLVTIPRAVVPGEPSVVPCTACPVPVAVITCEPFA